MKIDSKLWLTGLVAGREATAMAEYQVHHLIRNLLITRVPCDLH